MLGDAAEGEDEDGWAGSNSGNDEAERPATGFVFTEGPLWHPDGFYYFVDVRSSVLYRLRLGQAPETVRTGTGEGNGTTFDLQGRLVICEGGNRRVTRWSDDRPQRGPDGPLRGQADQPAQRRRLQIGRQHLVHRPGAARAARRQGAAACRGLSPSSPTATSRLVAEFEYPNGLAFSPDERVLYVANTRHAQYIHAIELDSAGNMVRRRIFADMSSEETDGVPDGMKVDVEGRVYCTGPGGTWVFAPDGTRIGIIRTPEVPANLAFGGPDLRTIFFTARTSVYTLRIKVPGQPHPWYRLRADEFNRARVIETHSFVIPAQAWKGCPGRGDPLDPRAGRR